MLPKITAVVRLARDIEIRYTQSGSAIANFSVVSSKKYKTQSGEQKEDTTFIDCTAFGRLAEICNQYLKKGSQIYIIGELRLDKWTAQDGQKRSKHSIALESMEMLCSKQDSTNNTPAGYNHSDDGINQPSQHEQAQYSQPSQQGTPPTVPEIDINEDELPF